MKSYIEEREMIVMGLKYTKMYTKTRNPERKISDITEELVKEILYSKKRKKEWIRLCRGDGRVIYWFRNEYQMEQCMMALENNENEPWYKTDEKCFSFSDEYENYNIWIAEFKSELLCEHEEAEDIERMVNSYYGIKEDDGRYSIYDVYSERELL